MMGGIMRGFLLEEDYFCFFSLCPFFLNLGSICGVTGLSAQDVQRKYSV
jgi:hypothetical protein